MQRTADFGSDINPTILAGVIEVPGGFVAAGEFFHYRGDAQNYLDAIGQNAVFDTSDRAHMATVKEDEQVLRDGAANERGKDRMNLLSDAYVPGHERMNWLYEHMPKKKTSAGVPDSIKPSAQWDRGFEYLVVEKGGFIPNVTLFDQENVASAAQAEQILSDHGFMVEKRRETAEGMSYVLYDLQRGGRTAATTDTWNDAATGHEITNGMTTCPQAARPVPVRPQSEQASRGRKPLPQCSNCNYTFSPGARTSSLHDDIVEEAKRKFDVFPSQNAGAWIAQEEKKRKQSMRTTALTDTDPHFDRGGAERMCPGCASSIWGDYCPYCANDRASEVDDLLHDSTGLTNEHLEHLLDTAPAGRRASRQVIGSGAHLYDISYKGDTVSIRADNIDQAAEKGTEVFRLTPAHAYDIYISRDDGVVEQSKYKRPVFPFDPYNDPDYKNIPMEELERRFSSLNNFQRRASALLAAPSPKEASKGMSTNTSRTRREAKAEDKTPNPAGNERRMLLAALSAQQDVLVNQDAQISEMRQVISSIIRTAGIERHPKFARFVTAADEENNEVAKTDEQALKPDAKDDPQSYGTAPASANQDVTPAATTDVQSENTAIPGEVFNKLENVTEPVAGAQDVPKGQAAHVDTEVRVGEPNKDHAFADGTWGDKKGSLRPADTMSALILAKARHTAGLDTDTNEFVLATQIEASLSQEAVESETQVLSRVASVRPAPQRQEAPRNLVPQQREASRTQPSLAGGSAISGSASGLSDAFSW